MISIIYFFFMAAPSAALIILSFIRFDVGAMVLNWDINFWGKFFIFLAIFIAYYFILVICINFLNGGLKRILFFPVAFGALLINVTTFTLLYVFEVIDHSVFNIWTLVFLIYLSVINLFALVTTFIRTFLDDTYHCDWCDRFGSGQMIPYDLYRQDYSYQKRVAEEHSYQRYTGTTVKTDVTVSGYYGNPNIDVKTTAKDNYETAYYTTYKHVNKKFTHTSGKTVCKKCGHHGQYSSVDPSI